MSDHTYPNDQRVVLLDCKEAFENLTEDEKFYAHYLSKAAWYGGLIVLTQTSLESPLIFELLHKIFRSQSISELKETALNVCGFTEDDFIAVLVYYSGILSNIGNYKGSGDKKFIPNLEKEKFRKLILASKVATLEPESVENLLSKCFEKMYSLEDKERILGFPDIGTTTYMSNNFTREDVEIVKDFFVRHRLQAYNTRVFKLVNSTGVSIYEIRLASVLRTGDEEENHLVGLYVVNGKNFVITRGDYSKLLRLMNVQLLEAKAYAANENEVEMIQHYVYSFHTGLLQSHIEGSRFWIKNKNPTIETYIGFIETLRDPAGMKAEFEGFVTIVNKSTSVKFSDLVDKSETELLKLLPWPSTYEKDKFLRPDFTALDVLTFSGSTVWSGICIPNYEEVRQNEGFKNVSLQNTILAYKQSGSFNYLNKSDTDLLKQYTSQSFDVQVGLHELLGHGSGKLFCQLEDGSFNFDIDNVLHLETNEKITSWYRVGDTYNSVFGELSSAFEECRAECVALYISTFPEVLKIFGHEDVEAEHILYVGWLSMCLKGMEALEMYEPKPKSWLQVHCHGRYVILQVLLEAGEDFVKLETVQGKDDKLDLQLSMDRSKILSVGKPAIGNFLRKLQLYRSTADVVSAEALFGKYSAVSDPFLEYRDIVISHNKPRNMLVQGNTFITDDGEVHLKNYDSSPEGMIQSWLDRFPDDSLDVILEELWEKDRPHFTYSF